MGPATNKVLAGPENLGEQTYEGGNRALTRRSRRASAGWVNGRVRTSPTVHARVGRTCGWRNELNGSSASNRAGVVAWIKGVGWRVRPPHGVAIGLRTPGSGHEREAISYADPTFWQLSIRFSVPRFHPLRVLGASALA